MIVDGVITAAQVTAAVRRRHRAEVGWRVVLPAWVAFVVSGQRWWVGVVVLAAGAVLAALWAPVTRRWSGPASRERYAEQWRSREFSARQELALRRCADPGEAWRWAVTAAARRRVRSAPVVGLAVAVAAPASGWLLARAHGSAAGPPAGQLAGAVVVIGVWGWIVVRLVRAVLDSRRWLAAQPTTSAMPFGPDRSTSSPATASAPGGATLASGAPSSQRAVAASGLPTDLEQAATEPMSVVGGSPSAPGSATEPGQAPS
jgi:hypothetical protein